VALLRKGGHDQPGTLEDERAALHRQRLEAAHELERLKRELGERIAAVRQREEELEQALSRAGGGAPLPALRRPQAPAAAEQQLAARAAALDRRARELDQREAAVAEREEAARDPDEERLARIEERLAELREAEKIFLRTQQELAARSEAVAARERLVSELERESGMQRHAWGEDELAELERRLRRLEADHGPSESTQTFSGGFSRLRRSATASTSSPRPPLPPLQP
jgi:DNA repair exonuclease SbcCD ATPase subunit